MGQAQVRKSNGTYFGQVGYVPRTHHSSRDLLTVFNNPDDYAFPCPCQSRRMFKNCCGRIVWGKDDNGSIQNPVSLTRFVYSRSELRAIRFDPSFLPAQWADSCDGCGGVCEWINVPNKVWTALGLDKEFLCVKCMSRLIDPCLTGTIQELAHAILSRKTKFNLQKTNEFFELALSDDYGVVKMFSVDVPPMTKEQFFNHSLTPRKESVVHAVPRDGADGIYPIPRLQRRQCMIWPLYAFAGE